MTEPFTQDEALLEIILNELRDLKANIQHLDHAIRGNGHPGLKQDVAALVARVDGLETARSTDRKIAGALFLAGLPIGWEFIKRKMGW